MLNDEKGIYSCTDCKYDRTSTTCIKFKDRKPEAVLHQSKECPLHRKDGQIDASDSVWI